MGRTSAARAPRGNPLWRRAPFVLIHFPGVLVAVLAASVVLGLVGAAGSLFLTSADNAALREAIAASSDRPTLTAVVYTSAGAGVDTVQDRMLRTAARAVGGLGTPVRTTITSAIQIEVPGGSPVPIQPIGRTGFLSRVTVVDGGGGPGVWLPNDLAIRLGPAGGGGLRPGDTIGLRTGTRRAEVRVAGTYRDLTTVPTADYWAPVSTFLRPAPGLPPLPAVMLADDDQISAIERDLSLAARVQWEFRLASTALTLPQAEAEAGQVSDLTDRIVSPGTPIGAAFAGGSASTSLPAVVGQARAASAAVEGPVRTVALAGQILALVGIAASALFASRRRRIELRLLAVRGEGPIRIGCRSALEALPALIVGGGAGWALGVILVRRLGPSALVQGDAVRAAALAAALSVAIGLVLVAVTTAAANRREADEVAGRGAELAASFPWEAVALALAAAAWYELLTRGAAPGPGGHLDRLLLLFPFLFIAGAAGLAIRGLQRLLGKLPAPGGSRASPTWLALRRLAAAPRIALVMVTAAGLAVGILVYAAILVDTAQATAREKALLAVGAPTAVQLHQAIVLQGHLGVPVTEVVEIRGGTSLAPSRQAVDILGVDPGTFEAAAAWEPRYAPVPLHELLDSLRGSTPGRIRAVVAGGSIPTGSTLVLSGSSLPLEVVGSASAFPGMQGEQLMLVVDRSALSHLADETQTVIGGLQTRWELWSPASPAQLKVALASARTGSDVGLARTAHAERSTLTFQTLSWSFAFLEALGILAGVMALVGLLLYLQARQQSREVAYALGRRMGMTSAAHRRSVISELGGMLGSAFVAGSLFAWVASLLVQGRLDPLPSLPPSPALRVPGAPIGLTAAALAAAVLVGAAAVQRRADRASVAEVMRRAE